MQIKRTNPTFGGNIAVLCYYPKDRGSATRMIQTSPDDDPKPGEFKVTKRGTVHFHKNDARHKKFIAFDSVTQVQVTVEKRTTKVRLKP
jgi:hypothetical protein